jgi:hypothetical protein
MPATQRRVMQYPPGTGFVLALFPAGFVLLAISLERTWPAILLAAVFDCLALYLMINPTRASYSMAPTMVICVLAAYFTAMLFAAEQRRNRFALSALLGFLIGLAVELPNLFLSSGYFVFFFVSFLVSVKLRQSFWASCSEQYFWRGWRRRCSRMRSTPAARSLPLTEPPIPCRLTSTLASSDIISRTCNSFCWCSQACGRL